ncbi:MAG: qorA 1 [Bacteriovoracaceae bacterium]|nr:qorA 1 [Bacteriovoracaceae bacterium]
MAARYKRWRVRKPGAIDRLHLTEFELPALASDQIRIETKCLGLNFADIFAILGIYSATPKGEFTPGLEFSGIVKEVGSQVSEFKPGDRVMGLTKFGGYSEIIDIWPAYCDRLPDDWNFGEGASYLAQAITAWYALKHLGNVQAGQNVLIHSAAGGVGYFALNFCKKLGAHPIGTIGSESKKPFLHNLGFSEVVVRSKNLKQDLENILGARPLHLALDSVGGKVQKISFDLLAQTGRLIVYGAAEYAPVGNRLNLFKSALTYLRRPKYDPLDMIPLNRSIMAFNIIWLWDDRNLLKLILNEMRDMGMIRPFIDRAYPFKEAIAAVNHLKSGKTKGKIVLSVDSQLIYE